MLVDLSGTTSGKKPCIHQGSSLICVLERVYTDVKSGYLVYMLFSIDQRIELACGCMFYSWYAYALFIYLIFKSQLAC